MKTFIFCLFSIISLASCAQQNSSEQIPLGSKTGASKNEAVADFSEGCFWHSEMVFQSLVGVRDAVSGYAGGVSSNPTYEQVSSGTTGYAETVQVFYDSTKVSYKTLVDAFFASQNPTEVNRQGNDEGTQYRSIAFYRNQNEKNIIDAAVQKINASKKYNDKVATQVLPFTKFYTAEQYHQEYIFYHPDNSYVQNVCLPEYQEFRKNFKGNFKN